MQHFYLFQTDVSTLFQTTPAQKQPWRVLKLCWGLNSFFFFPFLLSYITFWVTAAIQLWPIQGWDWVLLTSGEIQLTLRCPHIYSALFIIAMKWTAVPAKSQKPLAGFSIPLPWFNLREQTSWGARERCLSSWPQASVRQKKIFPLMWETGWWQVGEGWCLALSPLASPWRTANLQFLRSSHQHLPDCPQDTHQPRSVSLWWEHVTRTQEALWEQEESQILHRAWKQ